jgi:hypothetical protein
MERLYTISAGRYSSGTEQYPKHGHTGQLIIVRTYKSNNMENPPEKRYTHHKQSTNNGGKAKETKK